MDVMLLRMFQQQVLLQCQFMLLSAHELSAAMVSMNSTRTFYAIQSLLNAAANVSKAFWGSGGRQADDRYDLRDSIGIPEDSPLREVRMRNNFEHLDERLDQWWKESNRHNHVDLSIGPRSMISGIDDIDMFRAFDPRTADLAFWGQSFNIQAIMQEVQRILPKLKEGANKPHWDPPPTEPSA